MKKRFHNRAGGFFRPKPLTTVPEELYDVIAVNKSTWQIEPLDKVSTVDEAKRIVKDLHMDGFKFYLLENNTVLLELV